MQGDQPFELVGKLHAVLRLAACERIARKIVRVAQVIDAGDYVPNIFRFVAMPPTAVPPKLTPW